MGWTTPATATVGQVLTAAFLNTNLRDNLNYLKGSATATVAALEGTASTSYTDLTTIGPAVTITTDVQAFVFVQTYMNNSVTNDGAQVSFAVSGATVIAATDTASMFFQAYAGSAATSLAGAFLVTGLTAGSNTFTVKYKAVTGGTAQFQNRRLAVVPA